MLAVPSRSARCWPARTPRCQLPYGGPLFWWHTQAGAAVLCASCAFTTAKHSVKLRILVTGLSCFSRRQVSACCRRTVLRPVQPWKLCQPGQRHFGWLLRDRPSQDCVHPGRHGTNWRATLPQCLLQVMGTGFLCVFEMKVAEPNKFYLLVIST